MTPAATGSTGDDLRFAVLGPLLVTESAGKPITIAAPQQRTVLRVLLARAGQVVPPDALVTGCGETLLVSKHQGHCGC